MANSGQQKPSVFISYSKADRHYAGEIATALRAKGVDVFSDFESILPGESFQLSIKKAILKSSAVLVIVSPEYVASPWCKYEAQQAFAKSIPVIPVLLKGDISESPFRFLNHLSYGDLPGSESERAEQAALVIKQSLDVLAQKEGNENSVSGEMDEP